MDNSYLRYKADVIDEIVSNAQMSKKRKDTFSSAQEDHLIFSSSLIFITFYTYDYFDSAIVSK